MSRSNRGSVPRSPQSALRHTPSRGIAVLLLLYSSLPALAQPGPQMQFQAPPNPQGNVLGHGPGRSGSVTPIDISHLRAERTESGWQIAVPGGRPLATPAVSGGMVFVGGGFGSHEFYAFDAETGEPRWGIQVSDDGPTGAVVDNGYVAFNTESCTLFIVRAQDGSHVWSRWLADPLMSQPALADGRVYMVYPAAESHVLAAFDVETGNPIWSMPVDTDAITAPIVVGDDVYVTTMAGSVYRFAASTGARVWVRNEGATSAPWVDGDRIFVSMHDETDTDTSDPVEGLGYLAAGDGTRAQSRGTAWGRRAAPWLSREVQAQAEYQAVQTDNDSQVGFGGGAPSIARTEAAGGNLGLTTVHGLWEFQGSRPVLVGDRLLATVGDTLRATRADSGEELWNLLLVGDAATVCGHLGTPPAVAGGRAYLATTNGQLMAVDPASGSRLWTYDVGIPIRTQPAVVRGRVFVGATNGTLMMVDSGHPDPRNWPMWGGSPSHQVSERLSL